MYYRLGRRKFYFPVMLELVPTSLSNSQRSLVIFVVCLHVGSLQSSCLTASSFVSSHVNFSHKFIMKPKDKRVRRYTTLRIIHSEIISHGNRLHIVTTNKVGI